MRIMMSTRVFNHIPMEKLTTNLSHQTKTTASTIARKEKSGMIVMDIHAKLIIMANFVTKMGQPTMTNLGGMIISMAQFIHITMLLVMLSMLVGLVDIQNDYYDYLY